MPEETTKVWRTVFGVQQHALEDVLNKLAQEDLQVFRIDRLESADRQAGDASVRIVAYDIIAFNPTLLAQKAGASMQAMLGKLVGGGPFGVPPL